MTPWLAMALSHRDPMKPEVDDLLGSVVRMGKDSSETVALESQIGALSDGEFAKRWLKSFLVPQTGVALD